ncbi:MAG: glutamate-1-semialdehyde 2,1-aminomutase [SAR324 cluster bacterium]|nr:glutamate-1-semialdehyde 2,1-aminomutase [SAR324 cluster bacterium]
MQNTRSSEMFRRAQLRIPGGVNSPVRAFKSVDMNPLFISHGKGSKIYDVDGNEYIDYVGSWGPLILGHANEIVQQAIIAAVQRGTSFGAPTEAESILTEMVNDAVPSVEMLRLVNSGSEAALGAIRAARGYTGRDKVIKFEGCFHGSVDYLLVKAGSGATTLGIPNSAGVPASFTEHTLLAEFNDLESVSRLVDEHAGEIAAVILELIPGNMGMIRPEHDFLTGLRQICDREGILLIADEVMTGFRVDYSGAQALLGIQPDLSMFGKVIGGGLPVGAYGGRQDIMLKVAPAGPVYQAGTLSGNPVAVAAGIATLTELRNSDAFRDLSENTNWLVQALISVFTKAGIPVQTHNAGGMMGLFFSETPVRNYTDALGCNVERFKKFFKLMLAQGIYLPPSAFEAMFVSTAHTTEDLEKTVAAVRNVVSQI